MTAGAPRPETGRWLPDEARLVALVRDRGTDEWAAGVATGLADMVGRLRGRTFLINVAGAGELDRLLDAAGGPGLTSALTGAATVASVARAHREQKFAYLPAGEAALPYSALRRMQRFRRFLEQARDGGGTLLLYVGEEDLEAVVEQGRGGERLVLDGCIALGQATGVARKLGAPLLARVERPAPPPSVPAPDAAAAETPARDESTTGEPTEGPWRRMGSLTRLLVPIAALFLALFAWGLVDGGSGERDGDGSAVEGSEVGAVDDGTPADGGGPARAAATAAEAVDSTDGSTPGTDLEFRAPAARYSVLVGSYIRLSDAMTRRVELSEDGGLFYVAPTPVRGRVYHRVLHGAYEDRADAAAAMADLVADGRKEIAREWDVRPVRLAYDLGTFAERKPADGRVAALHEAEIPAYVLRDTAAPPLFRVYAGAFSSEADAQPLGERLVDRGEASQLISRAGIAP